MTGGKWHRWGEDRVAPAARRTDPETSHEAARRARRTAPTLRAKCLVALADAGAHGLTDWELADRVGSFQTSAGKRRGELMALGLVEPAEELRLSPHGNYANVWRITDAGRRHARELAA